MPPSGRGGVLSACDPHNDEQGGEHAHEWSNKYSYDDEYHYYECTVEGCDQHTGTEAHEFTDDQDAICDVCGYVRHVHQLEWKWEENPNGNHWQEYICEHHADEKLNSGKHDFSGENPNVCKVCGYDKTPPHTHHEVTKYDTTQHWTSYDCEEHKDEKINPQDHTYNNDPEGNKCDGCDYNRGVEHQHSVSETWSNDATSHWKIYTCWHHDKEQLEKADHEWQYNAETNKDVCKVCNYSVTHAHTNYEFTEKLDADQHWKSYACHPDEKVDAASHDFGEEDAEACSCGLEHIYTEVYALYSANQTYVGNQADAFGDWYEAVKAEANFDHVALNAAGDAVFYYKKAAAGSADDASPEVEYDEVVKYFAPRTYIIKASAGTPAKGIESVWFTVKATVGGELQKIAGDKTVLDAQKTGEDGTVKLTFTPVWGYTSTSGDKIIAYTVNIAGEGEYQGPYAMPNNYLYSGAGKALTVNATAPSDTAAAQTFTLTQCLGLGQQGMLENVNVAGYQYGSSTAYTAKLVSGLTDGWYKLDYVTTTKGFINKLTVCLDSESKELSSVVIKSGSVDNGGGEAFFILYLTSENKELKFKNPIGAHVANMTLTKLSDTLDLSQAALILANGTSEEHKIVYNIKSGSIKAGKYYITTGDSSAKAKFDNSETTVSIATNTVIEFTGNEKTVEFINNSASSRAIRNFRIIPITQFPAENKEEIVFSADNTKFAYSWTAPKSATYRMTLKSAAKYSSVSVQVGSTTVISSSTIFSYGEESASQVGYFAATEGQEYQIMLSYNSTSYPTVEFSIEEETTGSVEQDKEWNLEFDGLHMSKYFNGQFEPGLYLITAQADVVDQISINYTEIGESASGSSQQALYQKGNAAGNYLANLIYVTEEYAKYSKVTLRFSTSYLKSIAEGDTVSFKINFTKITSVEQKNIGNSFDIDFVNNIYAFKFTPETDVIYNLHLKKTDADLSKLKIMYFSKSGETIKKGVIQDVVADKTSERDYTPTAALAGGTEFTVVLCYQSTETSPSKVNVALKKGFTSPDLVAHTNNTSGSSGLGGQSGYFRTGIGFAKVENATKYELYEAVTTSKEAPAIGDKAFQLVKTYTNEDIDKYKVDYSGSSAICYVNNTVVESGKYIYYYLVISGDGDEYAPYISNVVYASSSSNQVRREYKVKLEIPQELVGNIFYIRLTTTSTNYIYGYAFVTPQSTSETYTILCSQQSSGLVVQGTAGWDYQAYTFPAKQTVSPSTTDNEVITTVNVAKKTQFTATVNLPDNFIAGFDGYIRVYLYKGDTKVGTNQNISAKKDKPLDKQYTFTFYADKVTEADKDNYYIGFAIESSNKLADGYVLPDKVKFEMSEDLMTGTATVNFADRCAVSLTFNLPANFSGGDATVSAYAENDDGTTAGSAMISSKVALEAGQTKVTATVYVPIGYKFTLKLNLFSGYTAEPVTGVDAKGTSASAEFTLSDHIDITVTVTAPEGTKNASLRLFEAENGQPKDKEEKDYIASATVTFEEGETSKVVHLYAPLGITEFIIGSNPSYRDTISSTTYCWSEYQKVTLDDNKGTATFAFEKAYAIHISVPHEYTSNKSDTVFIYSGDTQLYKSTRQFNSTLHNHDFTLYMPAGLYNKDAKYIILMEIVDSTLKTKWFCPALEFSFDEDTHEANVTMALTQQKDTVKVTITFPESYDVNSTTMYSFELYNLGSTSYAKFMTITPASIIAGMKDNKYSFDFADYAWSSTSYYNFYSSSIDKGNSSSWNPKQYYAEPSYATWDEASESYVLNIEVKERQKFELTVIAPEEMSQSFSLYLRDEKNVSLNYWTSVSISKGETNKVFEYYTSITDAEVIKAMHAVIQDLSDNAYYAKVTITPSGNSFSIKVEFVKKQYTFKAHITDIPVLVSGADKNLKFEVYEKVEGGESKLVEGYTFKLLRKLATDKEELIDREVTLYSDVWDPDKYEIKISFSATSDNQAFEITCEVVKAQDGENVYDINVTITPKKTA